MDSNLLAIADSIDREANRLEGFRDAAKFLRHVGSLEQAAREREAMFEAARKKHADMQAQLDVKNDDIAAANGRIEAANGEAQRIVDAAVAEAKKIIAAAEEAAQQRSRQSKDEANAERERARADAARTTAEAAARVDRLKAEEAALSITLTKAKTESAAVEKQLADFQARLAKAREEAKRLLG